MPTFVLVDEDGKEVAPITSADDKPSRSIQAAASGPESALADAIKHLHRGQGRAALRCIVEASSLVCHEYDLPTMTIRDFLTS